jgi:SAM-dependent methyltransferase
MMDYLDDPLRLDDSNIIDVWDDLSLWSANFGTRLLDRVPLRRGARVLDVGCATGFPLIELAQMLGPDSLCAGIDPWALALTRARRKIEALRLRNAYLTCGDGACMPFRDGSFDLIVSNLGLNNFADARAVLRECGRVARSGATIAITTNPRGHMAELYDEYRAVIGEHGTREQMDRLQADEGHRKGADELIEALSSAGFTGGTAIEDAIFLRYLDGSTMFRHGFMVRGFLDQWREIAGKEQERELLGALEARLNARAAREGELRLSVPVLYVEARRK